jgi:hypothetical protein
MALPAAMADAKLKNTDKEIIQKINAAFFISNTSVPKYKVFYGILVEKGQFIRWLRRCDRNQLDKCQI